MGVQSDRIGVDEEVDDAKGLTEDQVKEMVEEREAKVNAQLLEMVRKTNKQTNPKLSYW